jgi:O-antigen/teichoic acid export membrane protein
MLNLKGRTEFTALNTINLVLAAFLFVSPWLLGFQEVQSASWNAWACGLAIAILAGAALNDLREWEEWTNAALGLWVAIAPWALGFAALTTAMWTHVGVGLAVAVLAAIELWLLHGNPPARAA